MLESKGWISPDSMLQAGRGSPRAAGGSSGGTHAELGKAASRWPAARLHAVEQLWGDGFTLPGGAPETMRLVKPLGLSSNATLMLLGAGLGGPAAAVSHSLGAWVASFEADADLRQQALSRHAQSGAPGRVTISAWDPGSPSFKQRSANHALSLESLRGHSVYPLLESLAAALRPNGQIVLTELVCEAAMPDNDREFTAWCRLDDRLPVLPRPQEVTEGLQRLRFDVRVVEDLSDRHITQTLGGWRDAVRTMAAGPRPPPGTAAAFVSEAELWLLRIRLMRRLGVRLVRWHAIGP